MGCRFFMAARNSRRETWRLPLKLISPTLILGPSFTVKVIPTEAGGICCTWMETAANWRPCSERSCFSATWARMTLAGSYELSSDRPSLAFLKRSSTSLCESSSTPCIRSSGRSAFSRT